MGQSSPHQSAVIAGLVLTVAVLAGVVFVGATTAQADAGVDGATVSSQTTPLEAGTNTTISYTVTNTGANETSVILDTSIPANWTVVDRQDGGGAYKPTNGSWLWQTLNASEQRTTSLTVAVPATATRGSYNISGAAKLPAGVADRTNRTLLPRLGTPPTVAFGSVSLIDTSTAQLTISNNASETVRLDSATLAGADSDEFAINDSQIVGEIPAGDSRTVDIQFNATNRSQSTAVLDLTANRSELSPRNVSLTGTGVVGTPLRTNTSSISFGAVSLSNSSSRQLVISNDAPAEIEIEAVSLANDPDNEFSVTEVPTVIAADSTHSLTVTFDPEVRGETSPTLSITATESRLSPSTVSLDGTGVTGTPLSITANRSSVTRGDAVEFSVTDDTGTPINATVSVSGTDTTGQTGPDGNTTLSLNTTGTFDVVATNESADAVEYSPDTISVTVSSPVLDIDTTDLTFGTSSLNSSTTRQLTLTNNASVPLTVESAAVVGSQSEAFDLEEPVPDRLAATTTHTLNVTFAPTARGHATARLELDDQEVGLDGTGVAPRITITAADTELTAATDAPTNGTVTITNDGNAALNASLSISDDVFSLYPSTTNISPGDTKSVAVEYAPTEASGATNSSTLRIAHENGSVSPVEFTIRGTLKERAISLSQPTVAFGNVTVGESDTSSVLIDNTGTTTETVTVSVSDPTNFSIAADDTGPIGLGPGTYERLTLGVNATASGSLSANVTVENATDASLNDTAGLTATAQAPTLSVTEAATFPETPVNSTATSTVEITNDGTTALSVSLDEAFNATDRQQFSVISGTELRIPATESRNLTLGFTPRSTGEQGATLTLSTNDPTAPRATVSLTGNGTETDLESRNETVSFGAVGVANGTATETLMIDNNGTAFDIESVTTSGAGFAVASQPSRIAAGERGEIDLTFDPLATGEQTATVTVTGSVDGGETATVTTALTGSGRTGVLDIGQEAIRTGVTTPEGTTTGTVSVENTGLDGTELTITDLTILDSQFTLNTSRGLDTGTVLAGGSGDTIAVTFSPADGAADGEQLTELRLNASTADQQITRTIPVRGIVSAPEPTVSPEGLDVGQFKVNESVLRTVTVSNDGGEPFAITADAVGASSPAVAASLIGEAEVVPGGEATVAIRINSDDPGPLATSVEIPTDSSAGNLSVPVAGTATAPELRAVLGSIEFGDTAVGSAAGETITLNNTGNATLSVARPTITGPDSDSFSVVSGNRTLRIAAGSSQNITVGFGPERSGNRTATLTIDPQNDPAITEPRTVEISGRAVEADAELNRSAVSFGDVQRGQSRTGSLAVTNNGTSPLTITGSSITGADAAAFETSGLRTRVLTAGSTERFEVVLDTSGQSRGSLTGQLTIGTNDSDVTSQLGSTVVAPEITVGSTIDADRFGTTRLGTTTTATVLINNTGNAELDLTDISVGGADGSVFSVVEQPDGTVAPQDSERLVVEFDPAAAPNAVSRAQSTTGDRLSAVAQLNLSSNDPDAADQLRTVELRGEGVTPALELPRTFQFGDTPIGATTTRQATIENTQSATAPLNITALELSGEDADAYEATLADAETPVSLSPGESATVNLSLTPGSFEQQVATLTVRTNDTRQPVEKIGLSNTETVYQVNYGSVNVTYFNPINGTEPTVNVDNGFRGRNATLRSVSSNVSTAADQYSLNYTFSTNESAIGAADLDSSALGNDTIVQYVDATTTAAESAFTDSTLRMEVSKATLARQGVTPENVTIYHETAGSYESLNTELLFETTQGYIYEVTSDSYSVFAVGVSDPSTDTDDGGNETEDDSEDSQPGGGQPGGGQPGGGQPGGGQPGGGQPGGGQPGGQGGAQNDSGDGDGVGPTVPEPTNPDSVTLTASETAPLVVNDAGGGVVAFSDTSGTTVRRISFGSAPADTVVRTAEYSEIPAELDSLGGSAVRAMEILVPDELRDADATITAAVDREELATQQRPDQLVVLRHTDTGWTLLETSVVETTANSVVIEAETPGFSYFAVAVEDGSIPAGSIQPTPVDTDSTQEGATETTSPFGDIPVVLITVVFVLLVVVATVAMRR